MSGMSEASVDRTEAVWGGGQEMTQGGPGGMARKGGGDWASESGCLSLNPSSASYWL